MDETTIPAANPVHAKPATSQEVERIVRGIVVATLILDGVSPEAIEGDKRDFLVPLGANSIDALEVILSVEERFGFEFDDHELKPELLTTLNHFVAEVCKKTGVPPDTDTNQVAPEG